MQRQIRADKRGGDERAGEKKTDEYFFHNDMWISNV
jgi:hypothetical protein